MYSRVLCKLVLNDILMSFLHCKALRTAMYKRYINAIIIIIITANSLCASKGLTTWLADRSTC